MKSKRLSQEFIELAEFCKNKSISLNELRNKIGLKAHALFIVLLCFPFLLPIPIPGLSVIFGVFVILASFGLTFDLPIKLPSKMSEKKISGDILHTIFLKCSDYLKKAENFIKPRGNLLTNNKVFIKFSGFIVIISAVLLSLPMPPGFNFPPALVCVAVSLGILEKDLLLILLGHTAFFSQWALYIILFDQIKTWISNFWPLT